MSPTKILIIGASSGMGHSLAKLCVNAGWIVGITGRREHLLNELAATAPEQFHTSVFDVTAINDATDQLQSLVERIGGVDIIVISAGGGETNPNLDFAIEKEMIDLNITAFTAIADWSFRYFLQQGHGHLVAITSIAGLRGSRHAPAYNATKSYQIKYLEGLRQKAHNEQRRIIITDIRPGFVDTPMAKSPVKFWVVPVQKAARQIFNAIQQKKKVVFVSKRWRLIAWLFKVIPGWLYERL